MPLRAMSRLLLVTFSACTPEPSADRPPPGPEPTEPCPETLPPVTVLVGTGDTAYGALAEGDPLLFHLGPQGGYHVFGALLATGIDPGDPTDPYGPASPVVAFSLRVDGDVVAEVSGLPRAFDEVADGFEVAGQLVVFDVADPPSLDGAAATFSGGVEDRCGQTAQAEVGVVLDLAD